MRTVLKWLLRRVLLVLVLCGAVFVHVWYFKAYSIDCLAGEHAGYSDGRRPPDARLLFAGWLALVGKYRARV